MAKPRPNIPCSSTDCERPSYCKTLCQRHYEQQNDGKPLTPIRAKLKQQPAECTVVGCARTPKVRGLCGMHNYRVETYGDAGGPDSWRRSNCQVDGCTRPHQAHGYCATHLRRQQLYGAHDGRWMPQQCRTPGCEKVALSPRSRHAKGRCVACYLGDWLDEYQAARITAKRNPQGYEYVGVNKQNYLVHRLVMERALVRELMPFESPHHKNGIRHDNTLANLELWTKPQPAGQRPEDLVAWVVDFYPELVAAELRARKREEKTGQLRLET